MSGRSNLQLAYLFIGGTFSVFYVVVGLMLMSGKLSFGWELSVRFLVGAGIFAYGIFRAFIFYRKYKQARQEDQN